MNHIEEFRQAMQAFGLVPPEHIKDDGKRHRFASNGIKGDDSGWYILHGDDRQAGAFGCWRQQISEKWKAEVKREFTQAERDAWRARIEAIEAQRQKERAEAEAYAAKTADYLWGRAEQREHPYLTRKGISGRWARVTGGQYPKNHPKAGEACPVLLVQIRGREKQVIGLQRIFPDGHKTFIKGTPMESPGYSSIGRLTPTMVICEGYATAESIHAATGFGVVIAFNAGGLGPVAALMLERYPDASWVVAADDDAFTVRPKNHPQAGQPWNPGLEAASATGLPVAFPRWVDQAARGKGTDFNDLAATEGLDAVRMCFEDPKPILPPDHAGSAGPDQGENPASREQVHGTPPDDATVAQEQGAAGAPPHAEPPAAPGDDRGENAPLLIFASRPLETAQIFHDQLPDGGRILHWRGEFYTWDTCRYVARDPVAIHQGLYRFMSQCNTLKDTKDRGTIEVPFHPKATHVNDVVHALRAVTFTAAPEVGTWLDPLPGDQPGDEIIPLQNGFLHWPTRTIMPATDRLLVTAALEFDYNPSAGEPEAWLKFLKAIWPDDQEAIDCLAEVMGYLLTDDTSQQKIFMLIGPPRCGKGTILRVIEALIGKTNRASPTLSSLGGDFGLQSLIGKKVAMISDARLSGKADQQVVIENLLRISGEDAVDIGRKHLPALVGVTLRTRIIMATNELPAFSDASAAIANRFIPLRFTNSFLGKEDLGLTHRLLQELPAILLWALDGLQRLRDRGHFVVPASAQEVRDDLLDQVSPVQAFVADRCVLGEGNACDRDELYAEWKSWCHKQGRDHTGTKVHFGRQISAAFPGVKRAQPRDAGTRLNLYSGIRLRHEFETEGDPF